MAFEILVLCTHNSARSVLGECLINHHAARLGRPVRGHSAGSAPRGRVHPDALAVLTDAGIATDGVHSKSWDVFTGADAPRIDLVITVCDSAAAEACPVFLAPDGSAPLRAHWGYPDPSAVDDPVARRSAFDLTRQALGYRVLQLLELPLGQAPTHELAEAIARITYS
jgi:arsenate reductase